MPDPTPAPAQASSQAGSQPSGQQPAAQPAPAGTVAQPQAGTAGKPGEAAGQPASPAVASAGQPAAQPAGSTPGQSAAGEAQPQAAVYTLTLPEGSRLDAGAVERTSAAAKAMGLSQDHAQKALEFAHTEVATFVKGQETTFHKVTREDWPAAVKADKEIGGEHYDRTISRVNLAIERFATPEFKKVLNDTGYGNHPELVRIFERIGAAMAEDGNIRPSGSVGGQKPMEDIFYGKQEQKVG